ncbi:MAG: Methionine-tRNA ligase [Candidatus Magasanikbacteria bacterium GW2011_GWA2_42_32]|uniref:Methionine--tRNA ligase n=1 Tax=Candidatus Magasanikbacteria bacterium GW2011_GWA2_42_32 TaxID=1619039 RepID=A0A0G1A0E5_9BACT|nr:MAG: Methionine-tRNA ligase [Candidatus Magasanikbacteria bacterium GW2011_GWA2_42_32]
MAAQIANRSVQEFVDQNVVSFQELLKALEISNDDFIRTTNRDRHWPGVIKLWRACEKAGDIYKKSYTGFYCTGCEAFLTEKDLENGLCPEHLKKPELVSEENYFFRLTKYREKLKTLIGSNELIIVPEKRKSELLNFINSPDFQDFSVSRPTERMKGWGIPVPGDPNQTVYVWKDALGNYITALGYGTGDETKFKRYWPADVHVIGKGIAKFHAIFWPAMLMSAGIQLPKAIFIHGYITVDGQKMSKTLGNVIDPIQLVERHGPEAVRYFLLSEIPSLGDGDFTISRFETRYNSDLASGLGNLVARVVKLSEKRKIQVAKLTDPEIGLAIKETKRKTAEALAEFKFNEALSSVWQLIAFCDRYIDKAKPWEEKEGSDRVVADLLLTIKEISDLLLPFLPGTSEKIQQQLISNKKENLFPRLA